MYSTPLVMRGLQPLPGQTKGLPRASGCAMGLNFQPSCHCSCKLHDQHALQLTTPTSQHSNNTSSIRQETKNPCGAGVLTAAQRAQDAVGSRARSRCSADSGGGGPASRPTTAPFTLRLAGARINHHVSPEVPAIPGTTPHRLGRAHQTAQPDEGGL